MRPTFGREYIEDEFQRIADGLSDPLTVSLITCGSVYHNSAILLSTLRHRCENRLLLAFSVMLLADF